VGGDRVVKAMADQHLLVGDSELGRPRAGCDNHCCRMQRRALGQHVEQLLALEEADDIILDDLVWLRGDRLPERQEGFLTNQMLRRNLIGELLPRAGFAAEIGAQEHDVKLFAQPVRRYGKPSWATANDEQIMHGCLRWSVRPRVPTT
jgi:hypothetical protein